MKNKTIKFFGLIIAAVLTLCSCSQAGEAASKIVNSVISSAGNEISSAISEGMNDLSEGMNDLKEGLNDIKDEIKDDLEDGLKDAKDGISNAGDIASGHIDNIVNNIGSELSDAANEIVPLSTDSAEETTAEAETTPEKKQYTFRNKTRYDEHYKKHGAEFGSITQEQYLELANELINSESDSVLHKYSSDGDYMYFDKDTNYFLVLSEDGYIRTFFIPSAGIDYWNRQ